MLNAFSHFKKALIITMIFGMIIITPVLIEKSKSKNVVDENCLHRSFEIIEEYCQYDPQSHIMAVYLHNTGLKPIEIKSVAVKTGDVHVERTIDQNVTLSRDSSGYVYINITKLLLEDAEKVKEINEILANGPETLIFQDRCTGVVASVHRPPLGWSLFTYKGSGPLVP